MRGAVKAAADHQGHCSASERQADGKHQAVFVDAEPPPHQVSERHFFTDAIERRFRFAEPDRDDADWDQHEPDTDHQNGVVIPVNRDRSPEKVEIHFGRNVLLHRENFLHFWCSRFARSFAFMSSRSWQADLLHINGSKSKISGLHAYCHFLHLSGCFSTWRTDGKVSARGCEACEMPEARKSRPGFRRIENALGPGLITGAGAADHRRTDLPSLIQIKL